MTEEKPKLLPCPFCGGEATMNWAGKIGCDFCYDGSLTPHYLKVWNTRKAPAGYKLVPIEPTQAMLDAGAVTINRGAKSCWYEMISAAPEVDNEV